MFITETLTRKSTRCPDGALINDGLSASLARMGTGIKTCPSPFDDDFGGDVVRLRTPPCLDVCPGECRLVRGGVCVCVVFRRAGAERVDARTTPRFGVLRGVCR